MWAKQYDNSKKSTRKPFGVRWWQGEHNEDQKVKTFATDKEAKAFLATKADNAPVIESLLFGDIANRWLDHGRMTKSYNTIKTQESVLRVHILPVFGKMPITDITREMLEDFLLDEKLPKAIPETAQRILNAILNEAVKNKKIPENPMGGKNSIKVPKSKHKQVYVKFTGAQLEECNQDLNPEWRLATWIMYGTGARICETLALKTDSIIDNGGYIRIEDQVTEEEGRNVKPAKWRDEDDNDNGRDVPLAPWLKERIEKHIAEFDIPEGGHLFPDFTGERKTLGDGAWRDKFKRGRRKAGFGPEMHPHHLRDHFVSVQLSRGIPITDVAEWIGHRDINLTFKTYRFMIPKGANKSRKVSQKGYESFMAGVAA